jgi:hypothetical protein
MLGIISFLCSVLTLYIIKLTKYTGSSFGNLVLHLTIAQSIYDLSFFLLPWYRNIVVINITNFLAVYGGTATSLISNIMSYVVISVVLYQKTLDVKSYIVQIISTVTILSIVFAIFEVAFYNDSQHLDLVDKVYYWWRLVSIAFNIICFCIVAYKMYVYESTWNVNPLKVLVNRFKW